MKIPYGFELVPEGEIIGRNNRDIQWLSESGATGPFIGVPDKTAGEWLRFYDDHEAVAFIRKLPAPSGWVSVKERLPSEPGRVLAINHFDGKAHCTTWNGVSFTLNPKPYAWMPIPPPPAPPKSDAEIAWERYYSTVEKNSVLSVFDSIKAAFIAGFNAEVAK